MKRITVPREEFDFAGFTRAILRFLQKNVPNWIPSSYGVARVEHPGGIPEDGPGTGPDDFIAELRTGSLLFFPFSASNVGEPIPCADGRSRKLPEDAEFVIGEVDCVGYLVKLTRSRFQIDSAIHAGGACPAPPPSVDVADCGIFDVPMENFVRKFVKP